MSMTERELLAAIHGMGLGGAFLLAFTGGLEALWCLRPEWARGPGSAAQMRRLRLGVCGIALLAWLTILSGLYGVYPLYRAEPAAGADLSQFPRAYLLANPALAAWHTFGADWKAHIAVLCPILATAVAAVVVRYGRELAEQAQIRHALMVLLTLAFATAGVAGGLGALLTKAAPIR